VRLGLVEFLLGCSEPTECAQGALEWLGTHTGVRRALCLISEPEEARLGVLAAHGLSAARALRVGIDLSQRGDPLVSVMERASPLEFAPNGGGRGGSLGSVFGTTPVLVLPLARAGAAAEASPGLLVVSPSGPAIREPATWVGAVLGARLTQLRQRRAVETARRALERERGLLDSIVNAVPDPVLLTDTEGRLIFANVRAEALFASTERESEGRRRAVALINMLFSAALSGRAISRGEPLRRELLLVDPTEGSDLLFELLSAVVHDPDQGPRIVSVLRNVTDLRTATDELEEQYRKLREAEAEIRTERDRLDLVIDAVADPILVTDPGGAIILMNPTAARLFTATDEQAPENLVRVQSNDAHFTSFISNLLFAGDILRYEGSIGLTEPLTGEPLPVEAVGGKVLSAHGELIGVVTILHDQRAALEKERLYEQLKEASEALEEKVRQATTELVRQNELLRRQAIQLEQASALKSQFLANMSHEFRTPLNAILGYTSMLLQGVTGELNPQQRRSLGRVDSSGRHLLALISDILDISRIEAGKMPVHLSTFQLPELVAEVMAEVEPIISRTRLTVTRELAPDLPGILSDRAKVKQIVLNLLTNALKFTPEGSVRVSAVYDGADDRVLVAVTDTGIGIAEEDQSKVFDDFSQADNSTTRAFGGAGLGLAICRRLAGMLGGQITLQSKLGRGSTFTLMVPRSLDAR
jgi:signal transduction histidine kinase/PAS domain-containing protein